MTKVVIFAGGEGTRLAELTGETPKPMVPIGDDPIVVHIMRHFYSQGYKDFVLAVGYMADQFKRYFLDYQYRGRDMVFSSGGYEVKGNHREDWRIAIVETGKKTSTAARLHKVKDFLDGEDFFLTYGDCVSNVDLKKVESIHKTSGNLLTVTAVPNEQRYGLLKVNSSGVVEKFSEKASQVDELINGGFMMCSPEVLSLVNENSGDFSYETMTKVAAEGRMGYHLHEGFWRPCDTKRDYDALNEIWRKNPELFGE